MLFDDGMPAATPVDDGTAGADEATEHKEHNPEEPAHEADPANAPTQGM